MGHDTHHAPALLVHGWFDATTACPQERIQDRFDTLAQRPADLKTRIVMAPA